MQHKAIPVSHVIEILEHFRRESAVFSELISFLRLGLAREGTIEVIVKVLQEESHKAISTSRTNAFDRALREIRDLRRREGDDHKREQGV